MDNVQNYLSMIAAYERQFKSWESISTKIIKRYRDENKSNDRGYVESSFNILWSNVQTIIPAVFSRLPQPDVSRRFRDNDPVGRVASLILQRSLEFEVEHYSDYRSAMNSVVLDRYLGGRGQAWVRYEPHFRAVPPDPINGLSVTEDIDEAPQAEELDYECCPVDYVHWKDFGHQIARTWEEVGVVWRKVYMKRQALVERFGEELGNKIPLDTAPDDLKKTNMGGEGGANAEALIFEIWDKTENKAYWLSKSLGEIIDEKEDPYGLDNFFPCPKPLYATLSNESLVPTPDFKLYQDQANQLNVLSDRIEGLIKALQVKGVYDSSVTALRRLFTEGENNTLIPVENWRAFAEKNGLDGAIDLVDIQPIAQTLVAAYAAMDQVKAQVYEITGISDIIRGSSQAAETATAQRIKGQYGSLRLKDRQNEVARFAADLLRIKAQIMCNVFQPQSLIQFAAVEEMNPVDQGMVGQAIQLLKSNTRDFRIDVSADSLIEIDEQAEKESRVEFLTAVGGYIQQVATALQSTPQLAPLAGELLKFGVASFKAGRTVEGVIDQAIDQLGQIAQQPKPNPEADKANAAQQADQARMQMEIQRDQMQSQMQMQLEQHRAEMEAQVKQVEFMFKEREAQKQLEFDRWRSELEASVRIETANIAAKAKTQDIATVDATAEIAHELSQTPVVLQLPSV